MTTQTPLLDFFRRGEVSRDIRMLAAQGVIAPKAHEQIAILMLLMSDDDAEISAAACRTMDLIPAESLRAYVARSDVAASVKAFFEGRGIVPSYGLPWTADRPLVKLDEEGAIDQSEDDDGEAEEDGGAETLLQRLQKMSFTDRVKAAMRGTREMRSILIRDPNKVVATAVLSSPKVSEAEIETFARMATVSEDVLRTIAMNRAWLKNYGVVLSLAKNPKTPVGISLNLLNRLNDRDVNGVSMDRNVPEPLRIAARRRVVLGSR